MALARIQSASGVNTTYASTVNATFSSTLTNPSLILVAFAADLETTAANTPTDTAGNTYVKAARLAATGNGTDMEIWYALNTHATASNKVTVTDNGAGVDSIVLIEEWTGAKTSGAFDKTAQAVGSGTALDSGATATLSQAAELVWVMGINTLGTGNQLSLATGFTNLTQNNVPGDINAGIASKVVSSTTAVHGLMTTASDSWGCIVATFMQASSGTVYTMVTSPASFAYTTQASGDNRVIHLITNKATFILTGLASALKYTRIMVTDSATYIMTGLDIDFKRVMTMVTAKAIYTFTGMDIGLSRVWTMITDSASFVLMGLSSTITRTGYIIYTMVTSPAQFIITTMKSGFLKTGQQLTSIWTRFLALRKIK